jgi:hypothetical protein
MSNQIQTQTPFVWVNLGTIGENTWVINPKNGQRTFAWGVRANVAGTINVRWAGNRSKVWQPNDQVAAGEKVLPDLAAAELLNQSEGYIQGSPYHNIAAGETRLGMFDKILVTGTTASGIEVAILRD